MRFSTLFSHQKGSTWNDINLSCTLTSIDMNQGQNHSFYSWYFWTVKSTQKLPVLFIDVILDFPRSEFVPDRDSVATLSPWTIQGRTLKKAWKHCSYFRGNSGKDELTSTNKLKVKDEIKTIERGHLYSRCVFRHFFFASKKGQPKKRY